jgi:hypothetical protein
MIWSVDARIPVELVEEAGLAAALAAGPPAALLVQAPPEPMPAGAIAQVAWDATVTHAAGCACCAGRSGVALALDRLFQARVRGGCGWFTRVVAVGEPDAVREALAADAVTAARFRLAPPR